MTSQSDLEADRTRLHTALGLDVDAHLDLLADAAVALRAENERLRALLKPFAEYEFPEGEILRTSDRFHPMTYGTGELTVGDFRRAAAALKGEADDNESG